MAEVVMDKHKAKHKRKDAKQEYDELGGNNLAGIEGLGEVGLPDWMEQVDSSEDEKGGLTKERKNFDLGQKSVHDREELKEEQDEENDNEQYKQINKQNNNVASDDEEFEQQLRNAQIQAIQKQEEKLNALSSAYSQTNKEINEAGSSLIASQSTPHANIIEDTTNPTPQNKSKSKKGKKKRMVNNTVLNDEDAYKWQTELNFDDHEHHYQNEFDKEQIKDSQHVNGINENGAQKDATEPRKSKTKKKRKKTGRTMVNDPLAVEIANENLMIQTDHGTKADEGSVRREEIKEDAREYYAEISEEEESNFEDKLNKLQEESDDPPDNFVPPMVATGPQDEGKIKNNPMKAVPVIAAQQIAQVYEELNDHEAIAQLQAMFPAIEKGTIQLYYKMMDCNLQRTSTFIGQQMNMYQVDEEDQARSNVAQHNGISPDDVQFNLLAGNNIGGQVYDPNAISVEERKMIEQALRDSEILERDAMRARQAQLNQSGAKHASQAVNNLNVVKKEQQKANEVIAGVNKNDVNSQKAVNKVDKKDGKN